MKSITTLFVDIGGVLLTNGWDHNSRKAAAEQFGLDFRDLDDRHRLSFDTYEIGKLSLDEYLNRIVFYEKRPFSKEQFQQFLFEQSKPFDEMIQLVTALKKEYHLKVAAISNEGRELTEYRIKKFALDKFIDCFFSSCYLHIRKPDAEIYRYALDIAHVDPKQSLYLEDRLLFVQVAEQFGIHGIHHVNYQTTHAALEAQLNAD